MKSLSLLGLVLGSLSPALGADLVIGEVLYDPAGADAGEERIEIRNAGASAVDTSSWQVCVNAGAMNRVYWQMPPVTLQPGDILVVHWLEDGADTQTDVFTGTSATNFDCLPPIALDDSVGSVSLYENAFNCFAFFDGDLMQDFVQWGGSTFREPVAVSAGIWTTGAAIPLVAEGSSIAHDGEGDDVGDFFEDASPTLGLENSAPGTGTTATYGAGCPGTAGVPAIGSSGGPPVLGNQSFTLEISNGLAGAPTVFALGLASTQVDLGGGCDLLVSPVPIFLGVPGSTVDGSGAASGSLPIPDQPSLVGNSVHVQGFVIDSASPHGTAAFTDGLEMMM